MDFHFELSQSVSVVLNSEFSPKPVLAIPSELFLHSSAGSGTAALSSELQDSAITEFEEYRKEYETFTQTRIKVNLLLESAKLKNIAPGLTQSTLVPSTAAPALSTSTTTINELSTLNKLSDYSEFEHGLPPDGPWDLPRSENENLHELQSLFPTISVNERPANRPQTNNPPLLPRPSRSISDFTPPLLPRPTINQTLPHALSTPLSKPISNIRSQGTSRSNTPPEGLTPSEKATLEQVVSWGFERHLVYRGIKIYRDQSTLV